MKKIIVFATLFSFFALNSCINISQRAGSGNIKKETRTLGEITGVISNGSADVTITEGTSDQIEIEADDDLLPSIVTRLSGGKLIIETARDIKPTVFRVRLQIKKATTFIVNGSGNIKANGNFTGDNVHLGITGSGDIVFKSVSAQNIKIEIAGAGNITAEGKTEKIFAEIAGSGNVNCLGMESNASKVEVAGSGDVAISAEKALYVSITGSGDVSYRGNPTDLSTSVTGSGKIKRIDK
jgi:hypothetical protein